MNIFMALCEEHKQRTGHDVYHTNRLTPSWMLCTVCLYLDAERRRIDDAELEYHEAERAKSEGPNYLLPKPKGESLSCSPEDTTRYDGTREDFHKGQRCIYPNGPATCQEGHCSECWIPLKEENSVPTLLEDKPA